MRSAHTFGSGHTEVAADRRRGVQLVVKNYLPICQRTSEIDCAQFSTSMFPNPEIMMQIYNKKSPLSRGKCIFNNFYDFQCQPRSRQVQISKHGWCCFQGGWLLPPCWSLAGPVLSAFWFRSETFLKPAKNSTWMPGIQHFIKNRQEIIFLLNIFLLSLNAETNIVMP